MTGGTHPFPILISIDAEPDEVYIAPGRRPSWAGFESSEAVLRQWRSEIEAATRRDAHMTWLLRMDPQVENVCGTAGWCVANYAGRLGQLERQGDEIGLHVHPFRWSESSAAWISDFGNQDWVESCVRQGQTAFSDLMGRRPSSFSMGNSWLNQSTVALLEDLEFRHDLTLLPGSGPTPMSALLGHLGQATGTRPDCLNLPRYPYRARLDNFTIPDPSRGEGLWFLPVTTGVYRRPFWRRLAAGIRNGKWECSRVTKLSLELGPALFGRALSKAVDTPDPGYLLLTIRSHIFLPVFSRLQRRMKRSLDLLLSHPQRDRFYFATPSEALTLLGLEGESGSPPAVRAGQHAASS